MPDPITGFLGVVDIVSAIIIASLDVPIIGPLKWLLVAVLLIKGVPSLLG